MYYDIPAGHFYVQKVLELLSISWIWVFILSQLTGNQTMGINFWWGQHPSQETLVPMSKSHWAFLQSNEGPRNTASVPTARSLHCLESGPTADTIFRTSEIRAGRRRATWQSVFWPWTCFGVGGGWRSDDFIASFLCSIVLGRGWFNGLTHICVCPLCWALYLL